MQICNCFGSRNALTYDRTVKRQYISAANGWNPKKKDCNEKVASHARRSMANVIYQQLEMMMCRWVSRYSLSPCCNKLTFAFWRTLPCCIYTYKHTNGSIMWLCCRMEINLCEKNYLTHDGGFANTNTHLYVRLNASNCHQCHKSFALRIALFM